MAHRPKPRLACKMPCFFTLLSLLIGCELGIHPVAENTATPDTYACDRGATLFGGGAGTLISPYKICTRAHLEAITGAHLTKYFIQMQNIDLGGSAQPWSMIAPPSGAGFSGQYDGNSKTISNLYYNTANNGGLYVGLFSFLTTGGVLKNMILTGVDITTQEPYVGGLVGYAENATIQNCNVSGSISGGTLVGGVAGNITDSTVTGSSNTATVYSAGDSGGGLIGLVQSNGGSSTIQNSHSTGNVSLPSGPLKVGGFIGAVEGSTTIDDCYATGNVTGSEFTGGFIGFSVVGNTITDSYATGTVTSDSDEVGGFIGYAEDTDVRRSYATGAVSTSTSMAGGFMGRDRTGNRIIDCYARGAVTVGNGQVGGLVGVAQLTWPGKTGPG